MYNESLNPQIIYSLNSLSNSLFILLEKHDINELTITEVCGEANVNRATFYRNCDNIMDLVYFKIDTLAKGLANEINWNSKDEFEIYSHFFNYWYKHKNILTILNNQNLFDIFLLRYKKISNEINHPFINDLISNNRDIKDIKMYFNAFNLGGLCDVLKCWAENKFVTPINDIVKIICSLTPKY